METMESIKIDSDILKSMIDKALITAKKNRIHRDSSEKDKIESSIYLTNGDNDSTLRIRSLNGSTLFVADQELECNSNLPPFGALILADNLQFLSKILKSQDWVIITFLDSEIKFEFPSRHWEIKIPILGEETKNYMKENLKLDNADLEKIEGEKEHLVIRKKDLLEFTRAVKKIGKTLFDSQAHPTTSTDNSDKGTLTLNWKHNEKGIKTDIEIKERETNLPFEFNFNTIDLHKAENLDGDFIKIEYKRTSRYVVYVLSDPQDARIKITSSAWYIKE